MGIAVFVRDDDHAVGGAEVNADADLRVVMSGHRHWVCFPPVPAKGVGLGKKRTKAKHKKKGKRPLERFP
ncbi:hypothetical protein GKA01_13590 [Gluconobacter kanchanaburiensis NBRC 103587]|uniref:Uncharacterized protein n=1 Tax=Gluconobacter kanchanaburiensis NBRC 103587 TaxID=1307948 RepID=A0A511B904_9PROT|nr:hypothetical protein AA103587_1307 [Gluconobacter kanchanaburiensis NBRC 103587]GEK96162.1 hypothetical protein GKA01_13590 [Gluconobacter kanchanaburiensis NBRC 103587]